MKGTCIPWFGLCSVAGSTAQCLRITFFSGFTETHFHRFGAAELPALCLQLLLKQQHLQPAVNCSYVDINPVDYGIVFVTRSTELKEMLDLFGSSPTFYVLNLLHLDGIQ